MLTLCVGLAKGPTLPLASASLMHCSAGVPTAGPETETLCTLPSEPKTTLARDGASCPLTQAFAARLFACSALAIAPGDGVSGTPAAGGAAGAAAAAAGAAAAAFGAAAGGASDPAF